MPGEKLGQHFLKNRSVIPQMIAALELGPGETVVEIGPGKGALTIPLAEICQKNGCKLIAIERDPKLISSVKYQVSGMGAEIIEGDALKILPSIHTEYLIPNTVYKLVGNIPYYITGHLLRVVGELDKKPAISVLMVQKEVAERVTAKPPEMNLLAAATQIWADAKIIAHLKPRDFDPPPKVDSAVIKLTTNPLITDEERQIEQYYRLIRVIFKQPRKTAVNNLAAGLKITKQEAIKLIESVGLSEKARSQDFRLEQLIKLSTGRRLFS